MNQDNGGVIGKINTPTTTLASGVWSLDSQFDSQSSSIWPLAFPQTTIANACRFNDGSSDYLSKTPSGAGNRRTWTFSAWVKKCSLGFQRLIACGSGTGGLFSSIEYDSSNRIRILEGTQGSSTTTNVRGAGFNRDPSAWQHVVVKYDSTQGTSANRIEIYLNGVEVTYDSTTYPSENHDSEFNNTVVHTIGATAVGSSVDDFFDGYMTEVILIDGQALAPTKFGTFNPVTNIWEPIAYAGTYGTNGFRLDFANSSALGNDVSGNDNDYTVNNLTSVDQSTDTCSNNFATLNPLSKNDAGTVTFSEGNLKTAHSGSDSRYTSYSTIGVSSGKWYTEFKIDVSANPDIMTGIGSDIEEVNRTGNYLGSSSGTWGYDSTDGSYYNNGSSSAYGNSYAAGDIIGIALDLDNNKLYFSKNGTFQNSGDPTSGSTGTGAISITANETYFMCCCHATTSSRTSTYSANFGSPPFTISSGNADANGHGNFEYSVPSGYFALCTKNLAEFGG
jgi:hypothetical protein